MRRRLEKANRYIEMSPDNARKATEEYLKTWDEKRPLDIREFVLREKVSFEAHSRRDSGLQISAGLPESEIRGQEVFDILQETDQGTEGIAVQERRSI